MTEKMKNKTILAIGAHPDDIEYWSGGTLLRLARANKVILLVATDGDLNGLAVVRKLEQEKAAKLLGAEQVIFLGFPDSELAENVPRLRQKLLGFILKIKPDAIFSFDPENQYRVSQDSHPDHRTLATLVADLILIYVTMPSYIEKLKLKEKPLLKKPELWLFNPYRANYFVDISLVFEKKLRLLQIFKSQNLDLTGVRKTENFRKIDFKKGDDKSEKKRKIWTMRT